MIDVVDTPITSLLERNNIDLQKYLHESYKCLLISIFETMVQEMGDSEYKKEVKQRFLNSSDKALTTHKIVFERIKCSLSEAESQLMYKYFYAYFTKNNHRISYDLAIRSELLQNQSRKCNICKKDIDLDSSELDHIIPWMYVGDELGKSNLQMLCKDCNRRKSKNSSYNLKMFLVNK